MPIGAAAAGVAVAAFAKQSFDAAVSFDRSMTQIAALTNVAEDAASGLGPTVDEMRQSILALAGETAQSPQELAQAMYFLASAGLNAQQQMETLEASAKAAAVGLGAPGDIARITANALNVYADNGLKAADVTDTLVAAVREGSAEPDEFADALGRVLPIADKAGISFQQVAASLATMSNAGLDVDEGVTALRGSLQALISPTAQTQDALASIGLTVDDVVASMKQDGLIATLRTLDEEARKNTDSAGEYNVLMRELVPNVRALTGVFNLTGQEAEQVDAIFREVTDSTGDLAKAFETTQESEAFKLKQALNDLAIAGQELAADVLPVVARVLGIAADHADVLFKALIAYTALRFIAPMFRQIAVAQQAQAAAATEAAAANTANAAALQAVNWESQLQALNRIANGPLAALPSQASGAAGSIARLGNSIGSSGVPQMLALADATQRAFDQFQALKAGDVPAFINGITDAFNHFAPSLLGFKFPELITEADKDKLTNSTDAIGTALQAAGLTADEESQIIQKAMQDIGGSLNPDNIDEFAQSVQDGISGLQEQKTAMEEARQTADAYAQKLQAAREETDRWQRSFAPLQAKMDSLSRIGLDVNSFLSDFRTNLEEADDPMTAVQQGMDDIAQAAADWRAETSESITGVGDVLSELAGKTHLSTDQISHAFEQAAQDARDFSADLVTIAHTGGETGKDLANALLAGGPAYAALADKIASASGETRDKLVSDFGDILAAGDTGASKLQHALVPVLDDIRDVLIAIAKTWGIDIQDNAKDGKKHVDDLHAALDSTTRDTYEAKVAVITQNTERLSALKQMIDNIGGADHLVDILVRVHTQAASPWPDEALDQRLFDPLQAAGARKINGAWTLPIDVGVHSDVNAALDPSINPVDSPLQQPRFGTASLRKLIQIEVDNRRILRDIRSSLRSMDGTGGHHSGAVSGGSGGTGTRDRKKFEPLRNEAWWDFITHNVPRLPRGHTDIDFDHRHRRRGDRINVRLDRKHMDDEMAYEQTYRGF